MLQPMFHRLPRMILVRLMSLLLLATIGLQASEPVRELHRERGSAFSSTTLDVALTVKGRPANARVAVVPQPMAMPEVRAEAAEDHLPVTGPIAVPHSIGPPAFALVARQPAPRAPPYA